MNANVRGHTLEYVLLAEPRIYIYHNIMYELVALYPTCGGQQSSGLADSLHPTSGSDLRPTKAKPKVCICY